MLLSQFESLEHTIRVYVPSTVEIIVSAAGIQDVMVKRTMTVMSTWFGGATAYNAQGAWLSELGLVIEQVVIVESFATTKAVTQNLQAVIEYCRSLQEEMKQEAVAMEYDNRLYLIK